MSPSEKSPVQPMSDERLEELRRLVGIGRGVMELAALDCIAEIYRLRAENTALRKVIAEAASLNNSDDNGARRVAARILGEALLGGQPT